MIPERSIPEVLPNFDRDAIAVTVDGGRNSGEQHEPSYALHCSFGEVIANGVGSILKKQKSNGAIEFVEGAPIVYPQQSIFPLAYCCAGMDGTHVHTNSGEVVLAIRKLGNYLVSAFKDNGEFEWLSGGNRICTVDQRLTLAWIEGLRILREHNLDIEYARWQDRILRACDRLMDHSLNKLQGVRRFITRVMGTGTNHVALHIATVFRAAQVFQRADYMNAIMPIARAFAADIHPDGYWEEHGDLCRRGGPTPAYNYLSHCGMALMYEWTKEPIFLEAITRSTRFHGNFTYPNGEYCELVDERVRHGHPPGQWGLFGFSHWPEGRGMAALKFKNWKMHDKREGHNYPEILARQCENQMYWHHGPMAPAAFERTDHAARMELPAGIFRRGRWCVALSAMHGTNAEDPAYRDNPFALDRQKLFSVFHTDAGLVIDGSPSKKQPENSTFAAKGEHYDDYLPCGGGISESREGYIVTAAYKSFVGQVSIHVIDESNLEITMLVDAAGCMGPFTAAFTMPIRGARQIITEDSTLVLEAASFTHALSDNNDWFRLGNITVRALQKAALDWPMLPFNSYTADHKSTLSAAVLRVSTVLSAQQPQAKFLISLR
jgi:hypothetical protein